ncbi:folylpolyglutamate synthase/dihydrofolate synthase family protein [Sulfitobacter sp. S190]|uniref:bifunctional folylpolyglutamate synthase/dihydrofolate synthase n=1 Tax=Sulfitobacter sp. S190 TaxID=2867022 RepID=UPI0021A4A407|nr:folylpolyglutamate synthase/dihydrofolate synthase family protein [Sulfitobacter sp. S190]UWR22294.1 bifunctional folylpolyglutamate synthase/dihydrofolate synthase [Sulfitobacter sp. S190]
MTARTSDHILERMMALHPKVIDLTLDRMYCLLKALGNPQDDLPGVIHIAGTNGKGSTQAMIRAGLEAAGKRVHAYTSPHLARFNERIRLAGELIEEDALSAVLDECYAANGDAEITYFEITTCAALLAFARTPADYTLLEVGLGGRLDATNVVDDPVMTVITPVSLDHQQFLGNTLPEIAGEKAGIIKRRVPCVVGPQASEGLDVIEAVAARHFAPLQIFGQHWQVSREAGRLVYQDETGLLDLPLPRLPGAHQVQNAGMALNVLRQLGCGEDACEAAVSKPYWPARMQLLKEGPLVEQAGNADIWLDGGHNPAAGHALAEVLQELPRRPTYLICGMLNTKDTAGYLSPLATQVEGLFAVSIPGEAATLEASETAKMAAGVGMDAHVSNTVSNALGAILSINPDARVLICGSLYLAGNILRENA